MGRIRGVTPDETRARLTDAAAKVFGERGYERATIAEIAREAGLSSGAIYAHWGSKAELLLDTIRTRGESEIADLLTAEGPDDFGAMLVALGSRLEHDESDRRPLLVESLVAARRDEDLAGVLGERVAEYERAMVATLRAAQASGFAADDVSPAVIARFLLMVGLGARLFGNLGLAPLDEGDWSTFIARVVDTFRTEPAPERAPATRRRPRATGTAAAAGRRGSRRGS